MRVAALLTVVAWMTASALPAWADRVPSAEHHLVQMINAERSRNGLPRLSVASDVAGVAHQWSVSMSRTGQLAHNPAFGSQICCWVTVAENVAWAGPVSDWPNLNRAMRDVHAELMASSTHRANILGANFREVGVGVVIVGENAWITQNFRQPGSTPVPEPEPPPATDGPTEAESDVQASTDPPAGGPASNGAATSQSDGDGDTPGRVVLDQAATRLASANGSDEPDRDHPVRGLVSRHAVHAPEAVATVLERIDERRNSAHPTPPRHPVELLLTRATDASG